VSIPSVQEILVLRSARDETVRLVSIELTYLGTDMMRGA
jgi:hypothetical protein